MFGKKDTPDSPRVAARRNKLSQDVQIWDFEEQLQPRRPDTASVVQSQSGAGHTAQQEPQQDDWSAQLSELEKKEETQMEQQFEQEPTTNGQRHSKNKTRRRAVAAEDKPLNDDWFKAAMQQSAQLDALKQPQTV